MDETVTSATYGTDDMYNELVRMNENLVIQSALLDKIIVILWLIFIVISIYCGYRLGERMVSRS